ncbi:MAG: hypothetical protein Rubg2KO_00810 [Rubricoccaceae bacterium]
MDDNATPALPEDPEATPTSGEALPPELEEANGPLPGLVNAAKLEVEAEVTGDASAEALLAQMGVEDEGLESGQLVGMILAIVVSVAALAFALIYLFIIPLQQQTADEAEVGAEYPELASVTAAGESQITDYRTVDGGYGIPIERAMEVLATQYDSTGGATAMTRQEFNTAWIDLSPDGAVRTAGGREALSETTTPDEVGDETPVVTDETVGVDDPDDVAPLE